MSKCVKCNEFLHPDYFVIENIRGDNVKVCTFCHTNNKVLTIQKDDGTIVEKVSKEQAIRRYKIYIRNLLNNPKIAEVISKEP